MSSCEKSVWMRGCIFWSIIICNLNDNFWTLMCMGMVMVFFSIAIAYLNGCVYCILHNLREASLTMIVFCMFYIFIRTIQFISFPLICKYTFVMSLRCRMANRKESQFHVWLRRWCGLFHINTLISIITVSIVLQISTSELHCKQHSSSFKTV